MKETVKSYYRDSRYSKYIESIAMHAGYMTIVGSYTGFSHIYEMKKDTLNSWKSDKNAVLNEFINKMEKELNNTINYDKERTEQIIETEKRERTSLR